MNTLNIQTPTVTEHQPMAAQLRALLSEAAVVRSDEPLAKRTTLRVGGPADIYVEPVGEQDLAAVLRFAAEHALHWFVLGRGSNLLVKDHGYRGVVISLGQPYFSRIDVSGELMVCGAGARLKAVALEAKRHGLGGLEFLEGIPGSIGGALRMNAGAMGGAIFDVVQSVRVMDATGVVNQRRPAELRPVYRSCAALRSHLALSAVLQANPTPREEIEQRLNEYSRKRWSSQPAAPSAGCMFKNPTTVPAGKLIDELGLKGTRVGGAMVSMEHGNFIVTDGTATASDVLGLIEVIKDRARAQRGIELETEVEIVGE